MSVYQIKPQVKSYFGVVKTEYSESLTRGTLLERLDTRYSLIVFQQEPLFDAGIMYLLEYAWIPNGDIIKNKGWVGFEFDKLVTYTKEKYPEEHL